MHIQFKLRTLILVLTFAALLFAAHSRSAAIANRFVKSIAEIPRMKTAAGTVTWNENGNDAQAKLLADANLASSRYSLKLGLFYHPKVIQLPRSPMDRLLMRSTYRIEFKTFDKTRRQNPAIGLKLYHDRHESLYAADLFGVRFLRSTQNPR